MNILIVSATVLEVKPLLDFLEIKDPITGINQCEKNLNNINIKILITGVGMVNTALMMGKYMNQSYDLAFNVGICGSFNRNNSIGEVIIVTKDVISEMGAEDDTDFLTFEELGLPGNIEFEINKVPTIIAELKLKKAKGITVNTVHGNLENINKVYKLYSPDVESMEGAAFFAGCNGFKADYIQIRAISNYVETRDKSKWNIPLAIQNLNQELIKILTQL